MRKNQYNKTLNEKKNKVVENNTGTCDFEEPPGHGINNEYMNC